LSSTRDHDQEHDRAQLHGTNDTTPSFGAQPVLVPMTMREPPAGPWVKSCQITGQSGHEPKAAAMHRAGGLVVP
jgi:hypothetical protein